MRKLFGSGILSVVLMVSIFSAPACKRRKPVAVELTDEGAGAMVSVIHMADPKCGVQLLRGFYEAEQNSWRWTKGQFSVVLLAPQGASQKGADLVMRFAIPEAVFDKLKGTTITATVNGKALETRSFDKAGSQEFKVPVPASAFSGDGASVDFSMSKFLAAGTVDQRELGLVVSSIGFEAR